MNISQISTYTLSVFNENILPKLSPLQKKIGIVALVAFALITVACTACYALYKCVTYSGEGVWEKPAPALPAEKNHIGFSAKQEEAIDHFKFYFMNQLKNNIPELQSVPDSQKFQSALCFINADYDVGTIKQQYLFKNENGSPLTINLENELDKIAKSLKKATYPDLGLYKEFKGLFLLKRKIRDKISYSLAYYYIKRPSQPSNIFPYIYYTYVSPLSFDKVGFGSHTYDLNEEETMKFFKSYLKKMDIPQNPGGVDVFTPGEFYVDLNTPLPAAPEM